MSWNDEKVAKLKELWGKGNTASQIAEIIGGVTRNAVIGKAHRLNLSAKIKTRIASSNEGFENSKESKNSYYLHKELNKIKAKFPNIIQEIRGRGFLIGIKLYKDQSNFIEELMKHKLLTIKASENVIRILPPLNVKRGELDEALKIIEKVCNKFN